MRTVASCFVPEIINTVPEADVQGSTTQEPPPERCPSSVTVPDALNAAGARLPQEKELPEIRQ